MGDFRSGCVRELRGARAEGDPGHGVFRSRIGQSVCKITSKYSGDRQLCTNQSQRVCCYFLRQRIFKGKEDRQVRAGCFMQRTGSGLKMKRKSAVYSWFDGIRTHSTQEIQRTRNRDDMQGSVRRRVKAWVQLRSRRAREGT